MRITDDNSTARRLVSSTLLTLCLAATMVAQSFPSGSTGADGALNITTAGVTIFTTPPVGGGSVYNFTTINIASGSTLKLSGSVFPGPIYFLATIAGTIDLSGQGGSVPASSAQRIPTTGCGWIRWGRCFMLRGFAATGARPVGWRHPGQLYGCTYNAAGAGGFSGNQFLVPLIGGSGGGGYSGSGGAGGGALLIASSVSITVTGTITANGGSGASNSGGGSGGGIRLVAPAFAGTGAVTAAGGGAGFNVINCGSQSNPGGSGVVRLEFFQSTFTGTTAGNLYTATPVNLFVPAATSQPSIMVTSIGGVAVPASPTGSFTVPDVTVNSSAPLTVNISASNIPLGTIPTVYFSTENFPDQKITATAGLAGSVAASTTTATVTLNPGYSIGYVTATWTH
jgi:hypothetical protein